MSDDNMFFKAEDNFTYRPTIFTHMDRKLSTRRKYLKEQIINKKIEEMSTNSSPTPCNTINNNS